ncbi:hypothetical protein SDC9_190294 [bioreactor metagenome]|uniref:Uncharacterized protein n=1 Tax=bioreactor metagenome TaxID=1076179 RepID=A0A645HUU0_9ZZZZ
MVGPRIVHEALPRVDREHGQVDDPRGDGLARGVEGLLGSLDLAQAALLPPVPQVQVARMEDVHAKGRDQVAYAQVGAAKGLDGNILRELDLALRRHAAAPLADGQIVADDVGDVFDLVAPVVHDGVEVIRVAVAHKDKNLFVRVKDRRVEPAYLAQPPAFALPVVEYQQCAAHPNRETAVIVICYLELPLHKKTSIIMKRS